MIRLHNRCLCIRHRAFLYTGAPKSTNSTLCTASSPPDVPWASPLAHLSCLGKSLGQHSPIHPSSWQCTDTMHPITDMGDAACQRGDQVCGQPAVKDLSCSLKMCPVPIAHLSKPNTPISLRHVAQTCHNTAPYGRPLYLHCTVGPP